MWCHLRDGVLGEERAWGPPWWEMRVDRQVVAGMGEAWGLGQEAGLFPIRQGEFVRVYEPGR